MDHSLSTQKAVSREDGEISHEQRAAVNNGDKEEPIVSSLRKKLNDLPKRSNTIDGPTIFRVPINLRKNKENLIEPSVVSIGPYHHGHKHLAPMEDKKLLLLQDIMSKQHVTLEACVEKIKGVQLQARSCYSERVNMDDDSFVEMLFLDGTFIIQYICISGSWFKKEIGWACNLISNDLIMLENQIPFFIVQSLWDLYFACSLLNPQNMVAFRIRLCPDFQLGSTTIPQNGFHHLLHLCYHYVVADMSAHESVLPGCSCFKLGTALNCHTLLPCLTSKYENLHRYKIPCATVLEEAGIKCKKKKSTCKMMDITFQGGELEIPPIMLHYDIMPLFANIIAYEQSQLNSSVPNHFTSYVVFIDSIINTEHDVAILQRHGIVEHLCSSEQEAALFFNELSDGACIPQNHYLSNLCKEVNRYCDSKFHKSRAKLIRDYFNSPWSSISFVAACILLGLTLAQTYYAGYDHYHPSP